MSENQDRRDAGEDREEEDEERRAEEGEESEAEAERDKPPDELPPEERPFAAGKDAKRPPREEETPRTPGPPPNAPLPREDIGGRSSTNR